MGITDSFKKLFVNDSNVSVRKINKIGVLSSTGAPSLISCLESIIKNTSQFGRKPDFFVFDESPVDQLTNVETALRDFSKRHIVSVRLVREKDKALYCETLSKKSGVPLSAVEFFLLPWKGQHSDGYERNAMLLAAGGEPIMSINGDLKTEIVTNPSITNGIRVSNDDPHDYYLFSDQKSLDEYINSNCQPTEPVDLLGMHEKVIGKPVGKFFSRHDRESNITSPIYASYLGLYGDSGMFSHDFLLFGKGNSFDRLIQNPETFSLLKSRWMLKVSPEIILNGSRMCMPNCVVYDTSLPLPPFMPVFRGNDTVHGTLNALCYKNFSSYLPYAVKHEHPRERKSVTLGSFISMHESLIRQLYSIADTFRHSQFPEDNMTLMSNRIKELCLDEGSVKDHVLTVTNSNLLKEIEYIDHKLSQRQEPQYWLEAMTHIRGVFEKTLQLEHDRYFLDISELDSEKRWEVYTSFLLEFGESLKFWPAIQHSSISLYNRGTRMGNEIK